MVHGVLALDGGFHIKAKDEKTRDGAAAELPDEWGLPVEDVNGLMALYSWVEKAAKPERFEPEAPMASG